MELGGSQLNAIQLAAAVRDRGHEVIVLSEPGPLVERVRAMNLEHIEVPAHRRRPSPGVMGTLARLVRDRGVDVVHGYEWPPILEAFYGLRSRRGIPVVGTIMSMSVAPFVPRTVPLIVGTERIREAALKAGHRRVYAAGAACSTRRRTIPRSRAENSAPGTGLAPVKRGTATRIAVGRLCRS